MFEAGHDHDRNPFPHDGEGDRPCTGYGCDCDERNYGSYHRSKSDGSGSGVFLVGFIIAMVIGYGINELLGAIILIGLIIYIMAK